VGGVADDERSCLWCDAGLVKKEGETKNNFLKRRYCDKRHKGLHQGEMRGRKKRHVNCSLAVVSI
jgi:hypothetical protein